MLLCSLEVLAASLFVTLNDEFSAILHSPYILVANRKVPTLNWVSYFHIIHSVRLFILVLCWRSFHFDVLLLFFFYYEA
jgi:hypothetical protein